MFVADPVIVAADVPVLSLVHEGVEPDIVGLRRRGRLFIVCIVTLRSLGGLIKPMSNFSTKDTLVSHVVVGDIVVGRVNVAATM